MDDILIATPDVESHLEKLDWVLTKPENANLTIHPEKVNILKPTITFLGYTLCKKGITIYTAKTENLRDFPTPKTTVQVQSFLGLANPYNFVKILVKRHAR